ncbi:MAG TPA: FkbM family methyltransferase [Pseudomonas sp.]|uniref:FkbM family methyltransferase n=1 Tax=Pseudomonas sp. TaxID=306 RepID=UPI002B6FE366|nr:FkbM family methyltransferase [Pseudomonas sp.]HRL93289.1 FkbM family methyltransferase [Pseudomonas sp.]
MKCTVIIPFGPGHNKLALRAKKSVEEAISEGTGAFHDVTIILMDDRDGKLGRSKARNHAVAEASRAGADWIFFLDADDLMAAHAFNIVQQYIVDHDAVWGAIYEADIAKQIANERPNQITPITSLEQILINDPYLTLQMGHFVKTKIAIKTPFNESIDCGEDIDYYLRVWKENHCLKIDQPLFFNVRGQHSSGPRSATGQDWRNSISQIYKNFCTENEVISKINFNGKTIAFKLTNTLDLIQNHIARETFFELNELKETLAMIPKNSKILDIGSNIGNHALFFTILSESQEIHCFEPSTTNADSLQKNFEINQVDPRRYKIHRIAIGAKSQQGTLCRPDDLNSGATSVRVDTSGPIQIESLDSTLDKNSDFDLLKIDVEGMELEVLEGGKETIKNSRPVILIEVSNKNKSAFFCWCEKNNYKIIHTFELVHASNYLLTSNTPKDPPPYFRQLIQNRLQKKFR